MGFFTNKKIKSDEYDELIKKVGSLAQEVQFLKTLVETLQTNQNSLRGFVNRKLTPPPTAPTEKAEETTETENNKNSVLVAI